MPLLAGGSAPAAYALTVRQRAHFHGNGVTVQRLPFSAAVLASVAACGPAEQPMTETERAALRDTIVAHMDRYLEAISTLDPERVAALYVDSPGFRVYADGQAYTRDSMLGFVGSLRSVLTSFEGEWDTVEVTLLGRHAALAAAPFRRRLTDTAGNTIHDWGAVTWVWVRDAGAWRLIHGHAVHYPDTAR